MAAKQPPRKRLPPDVETAVLTQSRRRCALCFHLHGETKTKKGQVAHLDHRRANNIEDNLAYLCFDHHDDYDSTTRQHKNFTIQEVKAARKELYKWVEKGMPSPESRTGKPTAPTSTPQTELQRRQMLLVRLRGEYILSHDGLSAALLAGTEQPPAHWTNGRLKELGEKWTVQASEGAGVKGHESMGALLFGQRIFTPIGQVPGYEARAVEIHNSQRDYEQTYHGVRAELIFTHCDHKETIRKTAWLTGMNFGKIVGLQTQSADLDVKKNNRIFVIVYVRTHVPPAYYSYSGPPPYDAPDYSPLMEGLLLSPESQQFRFGKWEVKIVVTCDRGETMEITEPFNAD